MSGHYMGKPTGRPLVDVVRAGQRASPEGWKVAWAEYIASFGNSMDPNKHDDARLQAFVDQMSPTYGSEEWFTTAMSNPSTNPSDPHKQALVSQVKSAQREDPSAKTQWSSYCETSAEGTKDPSRHSVDSLQAFLNTLTIGGGYPSAPASMSPQMASLVEQVKSNQRGDPAFKAAWVNYCDTMCEGTKDPSRCSEAQLQAFMANSWAYAKAVPSKGGKGGGYQGGYGGGDLAAMVESVRLGQRSDPNFKASWVNYCDTACDGTKDPVRHTIESLKLFLSYNVPASNGAGGKGGTVPGAFPRKQPVQQYPESAGLAQQVKDAQRGNPQFQASWVAYCEQGDGTKDPTRHPPDSLTYFLQTQGIQPNPSMGYNAATAYGQQRQQAWGGAAAAQAWAAEPVADTIVDKIKAGQRYDPAFKEAWNEFCDKHCQGIRDPNRHPPQNMELFLSTSAPPLQNFAMLQMQAAAGKGGGYASMASPQMVTSPDVSALAEQVKAAQRSDPSIKAAWVQYCDTQADGTKDPSRHVPDFLRNFLSQYGSGSYGSMGGAMMGKRASPY